MLQMKSVLAETTFFAAYVCVFTFAYTFGEFYNHYSDIGCLSDDYIFRSFISTPLNKCVKECATRPMCQAVNFHSKYQMCELLSQDFGEVSHHDVLPCVMIKRSGITLGLPTECSLCDIGETCVINELTGTGTCEIKECKPLKLTHGQTFGNMYEIGSRIVYECDDCYRRTTDVEYSVCLSNGSWSGEPHCEPDRPPLTFCPGVVMADGSTYPFGTLQSVHTFGGSCTPSTSYCHGNGSWQSVPNCGLPVIALYLGCYFDCLDRILVPVLTLADSTTTQSCIALCLDGGFDYAYTEAAGWCACGNEVLHLTRTDESECNTACTGDSSQICGGHWRASLYDLTIQTGACGRIHLDTMCLYNGSCISGTC